MTSQEVTNQVKEIIAEITGVGPEEIKLTDSLEELFQGDLEVTFSRVISRINDQFELNLYPSDIEHEETDEDDSGPILQDLVAAVEEETLF